MLVKQGNPLRNLWQKTHIDISILNQHKGIKKWSKQFFILKARIKQFEQKKIQEKYDNKDRIKINYLKIPVQIAGVCNVEVMHEVCMWPVVYNGK